MYPIKISEKYDQDNLANLANRFTTMHLGNYIKWDFREYVGSHPWVDIYPPKPNSEVFSVLDWEVIKAWSDDISGNHIFIKHFQIEDVENDNKKINIVSCYLHLSELNVKTWDKLKEWDIIWKTGNTWISYWEHLHFQIDRENAPYHVYWPYSWAEAKRAWVSFSEWVNKWLWIEKAKKYTINPLVFLDKLEKYRNNQNDENDEVVVSISEEVASIDNKLVNNTKSYFKDIDKNDELYNYINYLASKKILKSKNELLEYKNDIPRIEFFIATIYEYKNKLQNNTSKYKIDLKNKFWFRDFIKTDKNLPLLLKNRKEKYITRIETLEILISIFVWEIKNEYTKNINDISEDNSFAKFVEYWLNNWLVETDNWYFYPNKKISKQDFLKILFKLTKNDFTVV